MKNNKTAGQKRLYWDVYENIMPTDLLAQTNVEGYIEQAAINNLAGHGLLTEQFSKIWENYSIKSTRIKDNFSITITKKLSDREYLFLLSNKSNLLESIELIYVDDYVVRDKLYINSDGVKYVTTGKKFAFKELENEQEKGE